MDTEEATSIFALSHGHAAEMVRFGSAQLHTTAAFIGGVAAQEVVKIVTHQYVPLCNCFIYNGIAASAATYSL
jgi:amyloid beta precursor protein binding protein 1